MVPAPVNDAPNRSMTRLDEAQERLARAIIKLEKASRTRPSSAGAAHAQADAGELAEAKARYDRLRGQARAVSERLDQTIARVRGLLSA